MYKALLVALIGLFFSNNVFAGTLVCSVRESSNPQDYSSEISRFTMPATTGTNAHAVCAEFYTGSTQTGFSNTGSSTCKRLESLQLAFCYSYNSTGNPPTPDQCSVNPNLSSCNTPPATCPDGSSAPNGDTANCPINCDILSGGGGPECDTEDPPNGYCSDTQTPIFDDCQYSPDDPRNPDNQPDPEDHCEQFPDSVSCNTELPELPDTDFCKKYPNALSCQTPEIPDLGTDTNPPPAGGTGVGTDTGTGTGVKPPPPEPPPTDSNSPSSSTDSRLDSLRYDISRLHSGLNYQTGILAKGLTGVSKQLQANGGKIDRSNTLLDGINKNLDVLNGGLKGDALTSGNFDVEGGINSALGITGDEKISDLVQEPVKLSDYTDQYDQFLSDQNLSCSNVLPTIEFSVMGKQYSFDINYQPACDWLANLGNFLLFITWIGVPAIVFGRRS